MSRCDACGSRVERSIEDWCPACGAPLVPDADCWDLGEPPSMPGGAPATRSGRRWWYHAIWVILALALLGGVVVLTSRSSTEDRSSVDSRPSTISGTASQATTRFLMFDSASGKYGYADETGAMVIEPRFERAGQFLEGLAPVQLLDGSGDPFYGYIDVTGAVVIEPRFTAAFAFSQGLARVKVVVEGLPRYGFIDRHGTMVIEPQYVAAWDFSQGLARVELRDAGGLARYGFIDRTGTVAIEPLFEAARDFAEGLAAVSVDGRWGYIDRTGAWVIEPRFPYADSFVASGLAAVDLEELATAAGQETPAYSEYGLHQALIDKTGRVIWVRQEEQE